MLSSIFIGLITFSYQNWSQSSNAARAKIQQINDLKTEINRRIFILNKEIEILSKVDTMSIESKDEYKYPKRLEEAIKRVNSKNCYVFEQFRKENYHHYCMNFLVY